MDKGITDSNEIGTKPVDCTTKQDDITTLEVKKSNGSVSEDEHKNTHRRGNTRSTLALINRRLRLFFRPWKWRRKTRNKRTQSLDEKGMIYRGLTSKLLSSILNVTISSGRFS